MPYEFKNKPDCSIICPKHGPLVELKQHCHNVAFFFVSVNPYDADPVSDWFKIASGITEVTYISDLFDPYTNWCGPAIEYENAKSEFHSKLIRELTRFNFIWGGLESLIDTLDLKNCPYNPGKINKVNYFLREHYAKQHLVIKHYTEVVEYLRRMLEFNTWYGNAKELFSPSNCVSDNLNGLKVVYKIRNSFAHGAFQFSEPDEWNSIKPLDVSIIATSSRIVLMTTQMLLLSYYDVLDFPVRQHYILDYEKEISAKDYLQQLHLKIFFDKFQK